MKQTPMTPEERCAQNFKDWWLHHHVAAPPPVNLTQARIWYQGNPVFFAHIRTLILDRVLLPAPAKNHGVDVMEAYRENVGSGSLQLVIHKGGLIECDFDLWNPWDVVNIFRHLVFEVALGRPTDPFRVAKMLEKRGVTKA